MYEPLTTKKKKVLIAGTFDLLHPGHLHLIEAASKLGKVIAIVGTDTIVEKIKGHKPVIPEAQRVFMVNHLKGVDQAVLGHETMDFTEVIDEIAPDIILLGPDQGPSPEQWKTMLEAKGMHVEIIRLETRVNDFPLNSSSEIVAKIKSLENNG